MEREHCRCKMRLPKDLCLRVSPDDRALLAKNLDSIEIGSLEMTIVEWSRDLRELHCDKFLKVNRRIHRYRGSASK